MRRLVSAYAASPAHTSWDPAFEERFLHGLVALDGVHGLELPWPGRLHPHDDDWLIARVPHVDLALTGLPWTVARSTADPRYGLASTDPEGRAAALADARRLLRDAERLPAPPRVVLLHTAPRGGRGSVAALADSLAAIASWNRSGAALAIEHCDSPQPGHPYEKGFLPLEAELEAARSIDGIGLWLNWGRSAVEFRDPAAVTAQIALAAASGRLLGLAFSGAAAAPSAYGPAWSDAHLPLAETDPAAGSLLTRARAAEAVAAAGDVPWQGLKISRRPGDATIEDVLTTVATNLAALRPLVPSS